MKIDKARKVLFVLGILLLVVYLIVMAFELINFSPYNTRWFLWSDRALAFLFPSLLCFVARAFLKSKKYK